MKNLYQKIESAFHTEIDLRNSGFDPAALENTLNLLIETGFICKQGNFFIKNEKIDESAFEGKLTEALEKKLAVPIADMFACEKHFDCENNNFFLYWNEIKSRYLGLLMILGELNVIDARGNKIYFSDNNSLSKRVLKRTISKKQLDKILELEERLGEEAEKAVMDYETKKLAENGINKRPIQVSQIDTSAGFDILSFFSDSDNDNKYIEVKSCGPELEFYISANEINKASLYGRRYYLYLYDRVQKKVTEICNPYEAIFSDNNYEWDITPQIYKIKRRWIKES